ncbi:restriction endonuclease subunit S [Mesorhizobium sp. SP-1A]|uniref:restriction endonuclease subunit S n=1 Tax=Mesorhizobium sp. SP-1A TaxID=3077840 RepID=UPI0028F72B2B|nr:restriction endonuclease subunit S [Mesorhizobium sp. SP-1A]
MVQIKSRDKSVYEVFSETGKLPEGWQLKKLDDVFIKQPKSQIKAGDAKTKGAIPFFNCSKEQTKFVDCSTIEGENIFITTGGQTMYTHYYNGSAAYSTDVYCVKTPHDDGRYVHNVLLAMHEKLQNHFRGFDIKHLDKKSFLQTEIVLPTLAIQRQVASLISRQANLIEKLKSLHDRQARLNSALRLKAINGEKTQPCRISKIADIFNVFSGETPSTKNDKFWNGSNVWLTPKDLTNCHTRTISDSAGKITDLAANKMGKRLTKKGDVVVTTRATIGVAKLAGCDLFTNQNCHTLSLKNDEVLSEYMLYWLQVNRSKLISMGHGSTFLGLSSTDLREIQFCYPTKEVQERVVREIRASDDLVTKIKESIKIETQKLNWLRRQLLSGKFEVTEINENA